MVISTTAELPAVTAMEITDWNAANAGIDVFEQDAMTLQSMPLRARRVIVRLDAATVIYHATNLRVRVRTQAQDGLLAYVTFGPRATGSVEGLRVRSGMLVVAEPDKAARFIVNPGYESIAVLVRPDRYVAFRSPGPVDDAMQTLGCVLDQILSVGGAMP